MKFLLKSIFILLLLANAINLFAQRTIRIQLWEPINKAGRLGKHKAPEVQHFNAEGKLTDVRNTNDNDVHMILYSYNAKGLPAMETQLYFQGDTQLQKRFIYRADGLLDTTFTYWRTVKGVPVVTWKTHSYDGQQRLVKTIQHSSNESADQIWDYTYGIDSGRQVVTMTQTGEEGKIGQRIVTIYNEKGLVAEEQNGDVKTRYVYEYNANGEWIKKRRLKLGKDDAGEDAWLVSAEYRRKGLKGAKGQGERDGK